MKKLIALLFSMMLIGCISTQQMVERRMPGQPTEYKSGYVDGFESGKASMGYLYSKFQKSVTHYSDNDLYRQGWDDGYDAGKERIREIRRY